MAEWEEQECSAESEGVCQEDADQVRDVKSQDASDDLFRQLNSSESRSCLRGPPLKRLSTTIQPRRPRFQEKPTQKGERNLTLPHGWRTSTRARILGQMEGRTTPSGVRKWDGTAKIYQDWDYLRRDPELWHKRGNCLIHLYAQGQSRRGPAFKIPLSALLEARCHPMIERFVGSENGTVVGPDVGEDWESWITADPDRVVELYIAAPPDADRTDTYRHHLATRNFFAWVLRRNLVGETLGGALVELLGTMDEFRDEDVDNMADMVEYLDEEGYWDFKGKPNNALAALHLAEVYRLRDVYLDAFSHCVGMAAQLFESPEYAQISSLTKRHLRRAKIDADLALGQASLQLSTFLTEDLSETHLGLSNSARAHLERFRTFLLTFYSARLGTFPPTHSLDSRITIWAPEIYRLMRDDFEALYELLVDESFTCAENTPFLAQGGICAVQCVHSYDLRQHFKSLKHPLPLLPEIAPGMLTSGSSPLSCSSRRFSWSVRPDKLKPDERLVTHAALIKATNHNKSHVVQNPLVQAYRRFEEDSCSAAPPKSDRGEKLGLVDARKVRWILVYATYQVLRNITEAAPEVRDAEDVSYLLAVPLTNLPPWKELDVEEGRLFGSLRMRGVTSRIEIKPDIDYIALSQQQQQREQKEQQPEPSSRRRTLPSLGASQRMSMPPRSLSLSGPFSRNGTFRRSLSVFRSSSSSPSSSPVKSDPPPLPFVKRMLTHHEIVVQGYGNGINSAVINAPCEQIYSPVTPVTVLAQRSPSTASASSNSTSDSVTSYNTAPTTAASDSAESPKTKFPTSESGTWASVSVEMIPETLSTEPASMQPPPIPPRGRSRVFTQFPSTPTSRAGSEVRQPARPATATTPVRSGPEFPNSLRAMASAVKRTSRPVSMYHRSTPNSSTESMRDVSEFAPMPLRIRKGLSGAGDVAGANRRSSLAVSGSPGMWTIVSPSLGGDNTRAVEVDGRGKAKSASDKEKDRMSMPKFATAAGIRV